jgi:hypothetical protein
MIHIWCVCVGDKYSVEHVKNLHKMVKKNMTDKFQMFCVTDNKDMLGNTELEFLPIQNPNNYPGWWSKINVFELATKPSIYLDLDVIITGSMEPLVKYTECDLAMPKNWALSGHGGFQSSVMCWSGGARGVSWAFQENRIGQPERGNYGYYTEDSGVKHWGDQEYLTHQYRDKITEIKPGIVISYKYHARQSLPDGACVVAFHGDPNYDDHKHPLLNGESKIWINKALS